LKVTERANLANEIVKRASINDVTLQGEGGGVGNCVTSMNDHTFTPWYFA
jgi:hypothetical protein